jgi:hypothetical protein
MKKLPATPLDAARDRYDKSRGVILGTMKKAMYKSVKKLTQEMQHEKDMLDHELDEWVELHPNFPLSEFRKSEFGDKIKWGKVDVYGQLDPVPTEFYRAHASLFALERDTLAAWKT